MLALISNTTNTSPLCITQTVCSHYKYTSNRLTEWLKASITSSDLRWFIFPWNKNRGKTTKFIDERHGLAQSSQSGIKVWRSHAATPGLVKHIQRMFNLYPRNSSSQEPIWNKSLLPKQSTRNDLLISIEIFHPNVVNKCHLSYNTVILEGEIMPREWEEDF